MDSILWYAGYLIGVAGSSVWMYRDAKKRGNENARALALAMSVLFPIGLLYYVLSR